jgi:septal ring factor EnvC (AmiA/AmiB activator)
MRSIAIIALTLAPIVLPEHAAGNEPPRPATVGTVGKSIEALDSRARAVKQQLSELAERGKQLDAFAIARGRNYAKLARFGFSPIGGGYASFLEHATRLERLRRAVGRDLREAEAVARDRTRLARELDEIDAKRQLLEGERSALERSHAAIAAAEEREEAFKRAFQSTYRPDHTAVYGGTASLGGGDSPASFRDMKGRLPFPVAGRTEIRQAARSGSGPGLEMSGLAGAAVRSIHHGRVAFTDEYPELGRTVIVDHGEGFFSVFVGLADFSAPPGQEVRTGDILGHLDAGGTLYMELRKGDGTVEPAPWFGL